MLTRNGRHRNNAINARVIRMLLLMLYLEDVRQMTHLPGISRSSSFLCVFHSWLANSSTVCPPLWDVVLWERGINASICSMTNTYLCRGKGRYCKLLVFVLGSATLVMWLQWGEWTSQFWANEWRFFPGMQFHIFRFSGLDQRSRSNSKNIMLRIADFFKSITQIFNVVAKSQNPTPLSQLCATGVLVLWFS